MNTLKRLGALLVITVFVHGCGPSDSSQTGGEEPAEAAASSGNSELVQPSEWWRVHPRPIYETLES